MTQRNMIQEPMSEERLKEIAERAESAVCGPWEKYEESEDRTICIAHRPDCNCFIAESDNYVYDGCSGSHVVIRVHGKNAPYNNRPHDSANLSFISHARTDVPDLLAEVNRLRTRLEMVQHEANRWENRAHHNLKGRDDAQSLLASATDLLNSWARERAGVAEAASEGRIKDVINRLWDEDSRFRLAHSDIITGLRFQVETARAALEKAAIALPVLVTMLESAGLDGQSAARVTRDMVAAALAALSADPSGIGEAVRGVITKWVGYKEAHGAFLRSCSNRSDSDARFVMFSKASAAASERDAALDRLTALGGAK